MSQLFPLWVSLGLAVTGLGTYHINGSVVVSLGRAWIDGMTTRAVVCLIAQGAIGDVTVINIVVPLFLVPRNANDAVAAVAVMVRFASWIGFIPELLLPKGQVSLSPPSRCGQSHVTGWRNHIGF